MTMTMYTNTRRTVAEPVHSWRHECGWNYARGWTTRSDKYS